VPAAVCSGGDVRGVLTSRRATSLLSEWRVLKPSFLRRSGARCSTNRRRSASGRPPPPRRSAPRRSAPRRAACSLPSLSPGLPTLHVGCLGVAQAVGDGGGADERSRGGGVRARRDAREQHGAGDLICPAPTVGPPYPRATAPNGTLRPQLTRELDAHSARTSSLLVEYFKLEATPARPNACPNPAALGPPHVRSRRYAQRCPTTPPSAHRRGRG
jgi:hypothetical protein